MTRSTDPAWAWAAYTPDASRPWGASRAAHLCRRAGFGQDWQQGESLASAGPAAAVTRLSEGGPEADRFNETYDGYEKSAAEKPDGVSAWWLRRMIETPHPLLERMTLFWHSYFGVSAARVGNPELVCDYLHLLRRHALGRFDELLRVVVRHPAVMLSLNARTTRRSRPETEFAQALLQEYTVGPGRFAANDRDAVARALTGWHVSQWKAGYNPDEHDGAAKTILGQTGNWGREEVVDLLLKQPTTALHVVGEICRCLVSESSPLSPQLLEPLAKDFAGDFDLRRLVEKVLRSNQFFSAVGEKIKSPVDFAVGLLRGFEGRVPTLRLALDIAGLGQDLLEPPTVNGWAGGQDWISPMTLLGRARLAQELLADSGPYGGKLDPEALAIRHARSAPGFLFDLMVPDGLSEAARARLWDRVGVARPPAQRARRLAALIATLPEYQLA